MAKGGSRSDGRGVAEESHVCGQRGHSSSSSEQTPRAHARGPGILGDSNRRGSSVALRNSRHPWLSGARSLLSRQYRWRARCVSKGARRVRRGAAGNSAGKPAASVPVAYSTWRKRHSRNRRWRSDVRGTSFGSPKPIPRCGCRGRHDAEVLLGRRAGRSHVGPEEVQAARERLGLSQLAASAWTSGAHRRAPPRPRRSPPARPRPSRTRAAR
jgi:hypothetical protein